MIRGLSSVIPLSSLRLQPWISIRNMICGEEGLDIALLRRNTRTQMMEANSQLVDWFFEILGELPPRRQARILRFIWARERLPANDAGFSQPFTIAQIGRDDPDRSLPMAHTCGFQIDIPAYSSRAIMRR